MAIGKKTGGRTKGTPNKTTALLKDSVLLAATKAGKKRGLVGYLEMQATENPAAFMTLLGKCMPTESKVTSEGKLTITVSTGVPDAE